MKIACLIARLLLGLIFVVFGLNGFLHFIPMQPVPPGPGGQYLAALVSSHYLVAVFALQLAGGLLLLAARFVALGLTLLGPVIANIVLFHALMDPQGLPLAIFVVLLWLLSAWGVRSAFSGILAPSAASRI